MLNLDADGRENAIEKLIFSSEFTLFGLLLGLVGDHVAWLIALKAGILAERGGGWIDKLLVIGELFVMGFARLGAAEIKHLLGLGIGQD